jgi:hypothetical protein
VTSTSPVTAARCFDAKAAAVYQPGASVESGQPTFGDYLSRGVDDSEELPAQTGKAPRPRSSSRGSQTESAERKADDGNGAAGLASPSQPPAARPTPFSLGAPFFYNGFLAGNGGAPPPQAAAKNDAEAAEPPVERPGLSSASPGRLAAARGSLSRSFSPASQEFLQMALAGPLTGAGIYVGGQDVPRPGASAATASSGASGGSADAVAGTDRNSTLPLPQAAGDSSVPSAARDATPAPDDLAVAIKVEPRTDAHAGGTNQDAFGAGERNPFPRDVQPADPHDAADQAPAQSASARAGLWALREVSSQSASPEAVEASGAPVKDIAPTALHADSSPQKAPGPLKDLSIQVGQTPQEKVELHLTERAGEMRMAVRAADPEMAHTLRQALPELVNRLEENGFRTEGWRPAGTVSETGPLRETRESSSGSRGGDPQQQSGWSQQQGGQRGHSQSDRPKWVAELESSLEGGEER